ncbi:FAD-binding domain-containing protein [Marinomonas aquimarina]|nr:deoxyribodipyrimidine photo-lyase [Marinomonas aquimarina]
MTHTSKAPVLVWFKRDLRLSDHAPLSQAIATGHPVLLLYVFEPELIDDPHYDERHWRFVWQSLQDMQQDLDAYAATLHIRFENALSALQALHQQLGFCALYSYQEIGIQRTFERDRAIQAWCQTEQIDWQESPSGAVIRALKDRDQWDKHWQQLMRRTIVPTPLAHAHWCTAQSPICHLPNSWQTPQRGMQTGGATLAWQTLASFYDGRGQNYYRELSSPLTSRNACSRLSPYLAWGNISLREVYQDLLSRWHTKGWRCTLVALSSRLHWHCHFMQKFESECDMEWRPINRGYYNFPYRQDDQVSQDLYAWQVGQTGFPMVDACMRALHSTGYINFRMRAMLVSFLCHHLNIDWRLAAHHLARLFLDFEPGIHYPQLHMQAGITGANTIRIYNPVKQSQEQDPEGIFLRRWLPELKDVPSPLIHTPWEMTTMEETLYQCRIGHDYPSPIVSLSDAAKAARERLWGFRSSAQVQQEKQRILATHVRRNSRRSGDRS